MGCLELCWVLDCRLVQHQYVDDIIVHDCCWPIVVAIMVVRLDWLCYCRMLHLLDWPHWCNVPYRFPCCKQVFVRHLGKLVACLQSRCHGLCLVWCAVLDRWPMCVHHDTVDLEELGM